MKKLISLLLVLIVLLGLSGCDKDTAEYIELEDGCVLVDSIYRGSDRVECGLIEYTLIEYIILRDGELSESVNEDSCLLEE